MSVTEDILRLAEKNNGTLTLTMVAEAGFSKGNISHLVENGKLERSARGVYILPEKMDDEFLNLQSRYARGVYSHETALFLHDLTDRTPNSFHMTFPSTYNLTKVKRDRISCSQVIAAFYDIGIATILSPGGNKVKVYSMERTLCDVLRPRSQTDIQIVSEAFKRYAKRKDKNIPILSEYAKIFHVEDKLRAYLEVLL